MLIPYSPIYANDFMRLAKEFHAESIYRDVPFSEEKVAALTNSPFCMLSFCDGNCVGVFVGSIEEYYFSDECAAQDIAFFVSKDARGSIAAVELINAYEEWAIKQGVRHIHLEQGTAINIEKTDRFFKSIGYTPIGSNVLKVV
jgi:GNAT superfamily N-acetyltransferase